MKEQEKIHIPRNRRGEVIGNSLESLVRQAPVLYNLTLINGTKNFSVSVEGNTGTVKEENVRITPELVGDYIVKAILGGNISVVAIIGEPNAGKSTIQGQLIHELQRRSQNNICIEKYSWDQHLKAVKRKLGSWRKWTGPEERVKATEIFSRTVSSKVEKTKQEKFRRKILVVEMPAVGGMDYGQSTLMMLAQRPDSFIIGIAGTDAESQKRRIAIREYIRSTQPDYVIDGLARKYGVVVHGLEGMTPTKAGRIIRSQAIAGETTIKRIEKEIIDQANQMLGRRWDEIRNPLESIPLYPGTENLSPEEATVFKKKAYYIRTLLRSLPISQERRIAVVNPNQDIVDWHFEGKRD